MTSDLVELTAQLVDIPSVSLQEAAIADHVQRRLEAVRGLVVDRLENNVVARSWLGRPRRAILAGHLDTVPANGNGQARPEGDTLWGLGSTDMKGGLAVMLYLAGMASEAAYDSTFVFYAAEEIAREHSGLIQLRSRRPELLVGDVAVVCEPTDAAVEAGCQGVLKAHVTLRGARAHVSRPWTGDNAVHQLAPLLAAVSQWPGRAVELDGCRYAESLQAVQVAGGVASNVVPDEAVLSLNHRFAPDRSCDEAWEWLQDFVRPFLGREGSLELADSAPSAPPALHDPLLAALVQTSGRPVAAKFGWTDVAFFAEQGTPAANFGPGDPELAHTAGERVTRSSLERARDVLWSVLSQGAGTIPTRPAR